jgi:hypothetical protein
MPPVAVPLVVLVSTRTCIQPQPAAFRLPGQRFVEQVIKDVVVVAGEPGKKTARFLAALQQKRGHLQTGDPALRPGDEAGNPPCQEQG